MESIDIPTKLITSDIAVIKGSGEIVQITDIVVRVYLYMRCRYLMSQGLGGYFESWESIAAGIGKKIDLFKKGANRPDRALEKLGLLQIKRGGKGRSSLKIVLGLDQISDKVTLLNSLNDDYKDTCNNSFFVYKLYKGDSVVYVGRTLQLSSRIKTHRSNKDFDRVTYVTCDTKEDMNNLEGFLIQQLNPPLNKSGQFKGKKFKVKANLLQKEFAEF